MEDTEDTADHNHCFGCGLANPVGLHLNFVIDASDSKGVTATATVELARSYEGGRSRVHGGIVATLLDEAMSKLNKPLDVYAVTRRLDVEYLRPSPIEKQLTLVSRHLRREGRKLFHVAELLDAEGQVLAHAAGVFVILDRHSPSGSKEVTEKLSIAPEIPQAHSPRG